MLLEVLANPYCSSLTLLFALGAGGVRETVLYSMTKGNGKINAEKDNSPIRFVEDWLRHVKHDEEEKKKENPEEHKEEIIENPEEAIDEAIENPEEIEEENKESK